jgi:hypothetical protein
MGASDHRVLDMVSAALWRGAIDDVVVEGHPRPARQRGDHDASDTGMVAPAELVDTDVQAGIREQVVDDCHGLKVARSIRPLSGSRSLISLTKLLPQDGGRRNVLRLLRR